MKLKCLLAMLLLTFLSCSNTPAVEDKIDSLPHSEPGKTLIVYFSWSGHTQTVANIIHELIGCDMVEIEPEEKVENLKTSQKQLLEISKALFFQAKLLILDEPTNHLDIPTKEALEKALEKYDGTILFVSHDRMFLSKMANRVLEMGQDSKVYDCTYAEYIEKKEAGTLLEAQPQIEKSNVSVQSFKRSKSFEKSSGSTGTAP